MKKFYSLALVYFISLPAFACLKEPIEYDFGVRNLMAAAALSSAGISIDAIQSVKTDSIKIDKYEWVKADPAINCHDKQTVTAVFTFVYKNEDASACTKSLSVTMIQELYDGALKDRFEVSEASKPTSTCVKEAK